MACDEFDSVTTGVDVGAGAADAVVDGVGVAVVLGAVLGALDCVGVADACDSVPVPVACAPPLLPMVTPGATSEVDDVAPEVCVVVAVVIAAVVVDPVLVAADSLPVEGAVPVVDAPAAVEPAELEADDDPVEVDPVEVVSAVETP